jgi:hypothetical protein
MMSGVNFVVTFVAMRKSYFVYSLGSQGYFIGIQSVILPVFIFISIHLFSQETPEWKEVRESNGIKAYVMKVPDMAQKRVKVETVTESSLSALVALMTDASRHKDWVYANIYAEIVEQIDAYNWVYYGRSDAPWPVSDRDVVTRVHMLQNPVTKEVVFESVGEPAYLPDCEDYVRIPMLHAIWRFTPLGEGKVRVAFELLLDLGGNMPGWVINLAATKGPYNSLKDFIDLAHQEPYSNASVANIKEPGW